MSKTEKLLILSISVVLSSAFIISLIFGAVKDKKPSCPKPEQIEHIARLYLLNEDKIKSGKWLDCSGYTKAVYKQFSIDLPASSKKQHSKCQKVDLSVMKKGDLVFFNIRGQSVSHVGIYLGNDVFIHSPGRYKAVRTDTITNPYYKKRLVSAGRVNFDLQIIK